MTAAGGPTADLVLASASPGRLSTLRRAGVEPAVVVSTVDEDAVIARYDARAAEDIALVLARAKAEDVAEKVATHPELPGGALVLGCDSVLELDGAVYGKPADAEEARRRWRRMRGGSGVLHTGHWLVDTREHGGGATLGTVAATTVHFARLSDAEIDAYVATGEPLRVAGAFTVDGLGGAFVTGVEGDYHSVVGVSLPLLRSLLTEVGVPWPSLWRSSA